MTTSLDLLGYVREAIILAGTDADSRVYCPGSWPTQIGQYPIIKMRLISESREMDGHAGAPTFKTLATIRLNAEVSAPADFDNAGATDAETQLWALKRQIEVAVINGYPLMRYCWIRYVQTQLAFNSAATQLAGIQFDLTLEFNEPPENFAPIKTDDLDEADVTTTSPAASASIANLQE